MSQLTQSQNDGTLNMTLINWYTVKENDYNQQDLLISTLSHENWTKIEEVLREMRQTETDIGEPTWIEVN